MQQAVVCAVIINKPEKTGGATESGRIASEICEILDEWILGDRRDRLIHRRYHEPLGLNWNPLEQDAPYRNLPTVLTKVAIGVPSHDLRTLAADYMRRHDPAHAANVISTHLGHRTKEAGNPYRAECSGAAAQAVWMSARKSIAAGSAKAVSRSAGTSRSHTLG